MSWSTSLAGFIARQPVTVTLLLLWLSLNIWTWAVYRWDKRQAGRRGQRISERALLRLAWYGGWLAALVAVYAHRARYKARKVAFLRLLWIASASWVFGLGIVLLWAVTAS